MLRGDVPPLSVIFGPSVSRSHGTRSVDSPTCEAFAKTHNQFCKESQVGTGMRLWLAVLGTAGTLSQFGCICCPGFRTYANVIDEISSKQGCLDNVYKPRLDISRMGQPDWCGPINRHFAECQCEQWGFSWNKYNDCYRYPPSYGYSYPGNLVAESRYLPVDASVPGVQPAPGVPPAPGVEPVPASEDGTELLPVPPAPTTTPAVPPAAVLPPAPPPAAR